MNQRTPDRRLDRTNLRILQRLSEQGRISYSELADALDCSINTVRDRIFAMERRGVIKGYEADVDEATLGRTVHVLVFLEAAAGATRPHDLKEALRLPGIHKAMLTTGRQALMLELVTPDMEVLHELLRSEVYPMGYRNARILHLGERPEAKGRTTVEVTA